MQNPAVISVRNLSFAYPDGRAALTGLSLTIARGETVALIGPNGAGKSTFLLHLNGILHSDGALEVLGKTVGGRNLRWLRGRVGLVFQNPDDQLFSPTVFDDVAFGPINMGLPEAEVRHAVELALEAVGMSGCEARPPHHLSWGERKRVAIASVLSMGPEIVAFDEPTSNLDPRSRWGLIKLIRTLAATRIIATHDLDMVRRLCSRTIILDRGRIVADGPTQDILDDIPLLRASGLAPED
jgi:cobalt/nickel transport system ATP-binding protein